VIDVMVISANICTLHLQLKRNLRKTVKTFFCKGNIRLASFDLQEPISVVLRIIF